MSLEKEWLDEHVVPLLKETHLLIHAFIWNGNPPKEVLVWLRISPAGDDTIPEGTELDPLRWASTVKKLLEDGWHFDFTREQQLVMVDGQSIKAFGGDGAPLFSKDGMASVRLFRKTSDGVGLIIQIGCMFWKCAEHASPGVMAAAAVKGFFELFDTDNPMEVCAKYAVPFGQA